jgi:hypothetical protein
MLDKQIKREIADAVLNDEIGGMMFKFEDMEEVQSLRDSVVVTKSVMGFMANQLFDNLALMAEDYNDFVKLVFTEVEDEHFRLMMLELYNTISIEHTLNQYVLDLLDKY